MLSTVRRVLPHEYGKYRTHLKSLDAESKVLRFGYTVSDDVIDTLCDKFETRPNKHVLFAIENDQLEFVAIGHIALDGDMELAFSVLKDYQGQGMGNELMKRCIQWCRTRNIRKGSMVCLSSNKTIRHLCAKYNISIQNDHGETLADIELAWPDLATYMKEAADNNLGAMDYLHKRFAKPLALLQ
jgi:GNAT superfamily N-acetyltransferase